MLKRSLVPPVKVSFLILKRMSGINRNSFNAFASFLRKEAGSCIRFTVGIISAFIGPVERSLSGPVLSSLHLPGFTTVFGWLTLVQQVY